jgi:hypothetical protein
MKNSKELLNLVLESCQDIDGKKSLTCAKAFQIAKKLNIAVIEIGNLCNDHSIRICNCQLGCFK